MANLGSSTSLAVISHDRFAPVTTPKSLSCWRLQEANIREDVGNPRWHRERPLVLGDGGVFCVWPWSVLAS